MEEQGTLVVEEPRGRTEPLRKGNVGSVYELSPMQQGMLFASLRDSTSGVYITQQVLTLGKINVEALEAAWRDIVGHFPVFRTAFSYANREQPYQILLRHVDFAIEHEDWRGLPATAQSARFESFLAAKQRTGFDFNRAPLMSVALLRIADEKYHLVWTHHHIILDGWSLPRVYDALLTAYTARSRGRVPRLQRSEPFESFIHWLKSQDAARTESFWRGYLSGVEGKLPLPLTRNDPEPDLAPSVRYGKCELGIPPELHNGLKHSARKARVTLNTLIQLAWAVLLGRHTGRADVVFGAVTSGRPPDLREAESIVGLLINTLPVRVKLHPGASLHSLLRTLQDDNAKLRAFEHAALTDIARWSGIGASEGLFNTIVAFENYPLEASSTTSALPILAVQGMERPHNPLTLAVVPGREPRLHYFFDAYYYKPALIERLHGQLLRVLEVVANDPLRPLASIDLLDASERSRARSSLNGSATRYARTSIASRFEDRAREMSHRCALECGAIMVSYADLNRRANQLAHTLMEQGVRPGDRVGVLLERSTELVIALIAILKAGGVYVPLDVECPAERLSYMLAQSRTALVLMNSLSATSVAAAESLTLNGPERPRALNLSHPASWSPQIANPGVPRSAEAAAYLMYTSGSTGEPKAVVATHQGVLRLVSENNYLPISRDEVFLQLAPASFDASTLEIWGALLNGARLVIAPPGVLGVSEIKDTLSRYGVSTLWLTAAYFHLMVREQVSALKGLRHLLAGGDVLNPQAVRTVLNECDGLTLINGYGPTENTTFTCCHVMKAVEDAGTGAVPIGLPISNSTVYVVDEWLNPVPVGMAGELVTGGDGLAQGYYGKSALTAQRFVPDPFSAQPGARLYRTGDRVRWTESGVLEFLGRQDHQVKVRGFRIELSEIEAHLNRHEGIRDSVVTLREAATGESGTTKALIAYYIPREGCSLSAHELRSRLLTQLPGYMVPSFFVAMERFPITTNGKVDRSALPDPLVTPQSDRESGYVAPTTEAEHALVDIWEAVLKREPIGIHDNFFELGGDSILSIQIASRASRAGYRMGIKDIFAHPTIHQLARHCPEAAVPVHAPQEAISGDQTLLPVQSWFFEQGLSHQHHWNQSFLLEAPRDLTAATLSVLLEKLVDAHDALRLRFCHESGQWVAHYAPLDHTSFAVDAYDLANLPSSTRMARVAGLGHEIKSRLDISNGPLTRAALFDCGDDGKRLLLTFHHLVVDMVSWRVVLDDLERLYGQHQQGESLSVPFKTTPFQYWGKKLQELSETGDILAQLPYWTRAALAAVPAVPLDHPDGLTLNLAQSVRVCTVHLDGARTRDLLERAHGAYNTRIDDLLLCALVRAYRAWSGSDRLLIHLESHGREDLFENVDLARTVGWFTTLYPVLLEASGVDLARDLREVKEQLRAVPGKGIGYGLLKYLAKNTALLSQSPAQVSFNYLGQFDQTLDTRSAFRFAGEFSGAEMAPDEHRAHLLDVAGRVQDGQLSVTFCYSQHCHSDQTIQRFAESYRAELEELITHCLTPDAGGLTPSDVPLSNLDEEGVQRVLADVGLDRTPNRAAAIYPASPLQVGMLLESLRHPESGIYITQPVFTLRGALNVSALKAAWRDVIEHFAIFRTAFSWQDPHNPLQIVLKSVDFEMQLEDWRPLSGARQMQQWQELIASLKREGVALHRAPLMSVTLVKFSEEESRLVWTHHHILLDGWSLPRVLEALLAAYSARCNGEAPRLPRTEPYESYIRWVCAQDVKVSETFWREYLRGIEGKLSLPLVRSEREPGCVPASMFARQDVVAPATLSEGLRRCARDLRITLNTLVQAAWGVLLSRYSGTEEAVFGIVSSGRPPELREAESIVGLLINTVPLRVRLNPDQSARSILQQLHRDSVRLHAYEYVGLADIARWSGAGAGGLFDTILAFENYPLQELASTTASLPIVEITASEQPHNPLTLACIPGKELVFRFFFDEYYYDEPAIRQLGADLLWTLEVLLENPDRQLGSLLERFPTIASGKVDRAALPGTALTSRSERKTVYVAARTETERALTEIWQEALNTAPIGIHDSFFALGGDSILGMQIVSRANKAGYRISIKDFFAYPTIHDQAERCAQEPQEVPAPMVENAPSEPAASWEPCSSPLTYTQLDQWSMYVQTGSIWPIDLEYEIEGPVVHQHMERAVNVAVSRHQALWAKISRGAPVQHFVAPHPVALPLIDLSENSEEQREREIEAVVRDCRIDSLRDVPLMKARLVKVSSCRHLLLFGFTHMVIDGASLVVVLQDIAHAYRQLLAGEDLALPASMQISEVARRERVRFAGPAFSKSMAFWKTALHGLQPYALPRHFFGFESRTGALVATMLPKARLEGLHRVSARHGVTLQMSVTALICMALQRAGGSPDVILKVFLNGRDETENKVIVAPLYRELMLRIRMTEPTFGSVVSAVKSFMVAALEHQHCPWIIPVSLLQLSKWPAPLRALLPLWNAFSGLVTRTVFREASLHPPILANCAASIELPIKKQSARLPSGERGRIVDVNINMRLHESTDLAGFTLHGARVSPSTRARPEVLERADRAFKTLDFNFERDTNGDVAIIITGGGLTNDAHRFLLDILTELIEAVLSEESGPIAARRVV